MIFVCLCIHVSVINQELLKRFNRSKGSFRLRAVPSYLSIWEQGRIEMKNTQKLSMQGKIFHALAKLNFRIIRWTSTLKYCGVTGTSRMLGNSVQYYPKCIECKDKPEVNRRKRKGLTESDLVKKTK